MAPLLCTSPTYYNKITVFLWWITDDQALEGDLMSDDKRGQLFRYGRTPNNVFRFGKRTQPFRYGKRAPAFRYGRRSSDGTDDGLMMLVDPLSEFGSTGQHKRGRTFRYGKRSDE